MSDKCQVPPEGWACTRTPGHDGPCAAVPDQYQHPPLMSMRIKTLREPDVYSVLTGMTCSDLVRSSMAVRGNLYIIDDDNVRGYLPSRVWYDKNAGRFGAFRVSFYTSETLHPNARPFKDGRTYVLVVEPSEDDVFHYPAEWRVFIEHVPCASAPAGIAYVFIFGEDLHDQIIAQE